jgi:hypothetical protein
MGTCIPEKQEAALTEFFYSLIFHLTEHNVQLTFLHSPRTATDSDFVNKLSSVLALCAQRSSQN